MDIIVTHDQAVSTESPPRRKHKDEKDLERFPKSSSTSAIPTKMEKKKADNKKMKKKLLQIEEQNESLAKQINEKNTEIVELRKSVNSLNDVLNSVPIDELRCNSSIASSKLLELSKKNRQLRAEVEITKNRLSRKDIQIQKLEKDLRMAEDKCHHDTELMKKGNGTPIEELQSKLNALQQKLFETRNKNVELTNQLKMAQKCLQQEIGENFNLNIFASHHAASNWRGRAQQILHLQQKVHDLKERLVSYEQQSFICQSNSMINIDVGNGDIAAGGSFPCIDRPNVRRTELEHRTKVEGMEKEIAALNSQLEEQRAKILALKVRNKTLNDEITRHKMKANTLEEQSDFSNINVVTMNDKLNQQKVQYEKRISEMTRDMNGLMKQREELELKEEHMRSKVEDLEAIIANKDENIMELNANIKKLQEDLKAVCGGFLFSCREFRKEEFITILDSLEAEKNSLVEYNNTLNERIEQERSKNDNLQEQVSKQKVRISRLEAKVRDMDRELEANNDKKRRSQRISEYASNVSAAIGGSNTSLMSFTFENTSLINGVGRTVADDTEDFTNVTELRNRLELATEKITMLREKLDHISAEKENDIKTFENIINNSKNFIIEMILAQRESSSSVEIT